MKALSLTQPWASLVASGAKTIETRNWSTGYRGLVAIHAAKSFPLATRAFCDHEPYRACLEAAGIPVKKYLGTTVIDTAALPLGSIVALASLVHCFQFTPNRVYEWTGHPPVVITDQEWAFGDFTPGRYGFLLKHVRKLPAPIPCRGALLLWDVPATIAHELIEATHPEREVYR